MVGRFINRRRHERFTLPPMYTPVMVNVLAEPKLVCLGHCYDISEGGLQFELDEALPNGAAVEMSIELPNAGDSLDVKDRSVKVRGNVVWFDQSEPGPVRMAAVFSRFEGAEDRDRLFKHIISGRHARAA